MQKPYILISVPLETHYPHDQAGNRRMGVQGEGKRETRGMSLHYFPFSRHVFDSPENSISLISFAFLSFHDFEENVILNERPSYYTSYYHRVHPFIFHFITLYKNLEYNRR